MFPSERAEFELGQGDSLNSLATRAHVSYKEHLRSSAPGSGINIKTDNIIDLLNRSFGRTI
jgi:hypothetical protein